MLLQPTIGEDSTGITGAIISDQDPHLNRPHRPVQDAQVLVGNVTRNLQRR
ncbi:MAG: hypothetical protein L0H64_08825 [Pseudonocardia sp.]|nr:hypothetical protein [Pseudonocardia sp.]